MELLPQQWLEQHFPASRSKKRREYAGWIDQAGLARIKPVASPTFALALTLLWDDPHEAVGTFLESGLSGKSTIRPSASSVTLDDQTVRILWLRHNGQLHRIAEAINQSFEEVQSRFCSAGLVALGWTPIERVEAAKARFFRGEPLVAASRAEGVRVDRVEALIRATNREVEPAVALASCPVR